MLPPLRVVAAALLVLGRAFAHGDQAVAALQLHQRLRGLADVAGDLDAESIDGVLRSLQAAHGATSGKAYQHITKDGQGRAMYDFRDVDTQSPTREVGLVQLSDGLAQHPDGLKHHPASHGAHAKRRPKRRLLKQKKSKGGGRRSTPPVDEPARGLASVRKRADKLARKAGTVQKREASGVKGPADRPLAHKLLRRIEALENETKQEKEEEEVQEQQILTLVKQRKVQENEIQALEKQNRELVSEMSTVKTSEAGDTATIMERVKKLDTEAADVTNVTSEYKKFVDDENAQVAAQVKSLINADSDAEAKVSAQVKKVEDSEEQVEAKVVEDVKKAMDIHSAAEPEESAEEPESAEDSAEVLLDLGSGNRGFPSLGRRVRRRRRDIAADEVLGVAMYAGSNIRTVVHRKPRAEEQ